MVVFVWNSHLSVPVYFNEIKMLQSPEMNAPFREAKEVADSLAKSGVDRPQVTPEPMIR